MALIEEGSNLDDCRSEISPLQIYVAAVGSFMDNGEERWIQDPVTRTTEDETEEQDVQGENTR